jgi:UDP-N-acetylglucosamine 2-epimerase (non-hydrolysing)
LVRSTPLTLLSVVGARPNFRKLAPLARAAAGRRGIQHAIVHTGQHYDAEMPDTFFAEPGIPSPDHNLEAGSGSHAAQTALIMQRFEPVCLWTMPEEINRVVTDRLADPLFSPSWDAVENLRMEGVPAERVHMVGNIMVDTLVALLPRAREAGAARRLGVGDRPFVFVTLHRPDNVDSPAALRELLDTLPYVETLSLLERARLVITDSGGLQEETSYLGVPCLTVRSSTERPVTCSLGTN